MAEVVATSSILLFFFIIIYSISLSSETLVLSVCNTCVAFLKYLCRSAGTLVSCKRVALTCAAVIFLL
ncbi:hypothetical protein DWZ32_18490 [Bacteroides intestinalis]|uniref:Uncharacterized protein n=1 Tax=Bacteroides intestinalis TaxID=329854 RepID=A0AB37M950_9BACE|nr:hypothetical protein DWZ32_18490 [Bacteroides intestinalis]